MTYLATSINESPVISEKAGAALADVRGKAVKFDGNGNVVLAAAGELAIGIGILTNDVNIEAGKDVDIQIKDIGLVRAGGEIAKGAELASDANGCLVAATEGQHVLAIALQAAIAADTFISARLVSYPKPVGAEEDATEEDTAEE